MSHASCTIIPTLHAFAHSNEDVWLASTVTWPGHVTKRCQNRVRDTGRPYWFLCFRLPVFYRIDHFFSIIYKLSFNSTFHFHFSLNYNSKNGYKNNWTVWRWSIEYLWYLSESCWRRRRSRVVTSPRKGGWANPKRSRTYWNKSWD